jgi:hypothetical protein
MKRIISVLMAALLVLVLSVPAYAAYTADDLANKLYSGWSTTSTPLSGSWYALVKSYLSGIDADLSLYLPYLKNLGSSTDSDSSYTLVGTSKFLHNILGTTTYGSVTYQLSQIRTLLTTISNSSSAWTSAQASTVTSKVDSIDSILSEANSSLLNSESWLSEIYNYSVLNETNTSNFSSDFRSLMSGWSPSQLQSQYINKNSPSWFGVVGYSVNQLFGKLTGKLKVSTMTDEDFGNAYWYKGVYGTLYRLQQVLATDDDLQMRQDSEENKNAAKEGFLSADSDTSVKSSDITGLSNLGSGLRSNFDTGTVEASNLFDFWGSDSTFSWFTQETKNNMVNVQTSEVATFALNDEPIYYSPYGEHMEEYERLMREGIK